MATMPANGGGYCHPYKRLKLTLGQPLMIIAPHAVETIVRQPPDHWLSNARMTHYQSLLLDPERVRFGPAVALNSATLLPDP